MKILVVAAMPSELKVIKEWIKSAKLKTNLNIDYFCCGVGNYETISSLVHYLTQNPEPTFIWNIWICGYRNQNKEKKSDPFQVTSVVNIHTEKEMIIPPFLQIAPMKNCFCSENIVLEKPKFQNEISLINEEMYFDMESRGVEFVASKYKLPRLVLKIPYDFIWEEEIIKRNCYKEMLGKIAEILKNLPYHDYLEKILRWLDSQQNS